MPRSKRPVSLVSEEEEDATTVQQRVSELRRKRDARLEDVVNETKAALADLQAKLVADQEEHEKQRGQQLARIVQKITDSVQKRRMIEVAMMREVEKANGLIEHMDDLMEVGFEGREQDAMKHVRPKKTGSRKKGTISRQ